jgi:excinuclease ABC subunit C
MIKPDFKEIPTAPGVYRYIDKFGEVIYVGKAKNLRARLTSYFNGKVNVKTAAMLENADHLDWTIVGSEHEALILEFNYIQKYDPRFNIVFKFNSKSYPFIAITKHEFPRIFLVHKDVKSARNSKTLTLLGPVSDGANMNKAIGSLNTLLGVRRCADTVFKQYKKSGRPCLTGQIGKCSKPCVGALSAAEYAEKVNTIKRVLEGDAKDVLDKYHALMESASASEHYEMAAYYRDVILAINKVSTDKQVKSSAFLGEHKSVDVYGFAIDDLTISLYLLRIRGGYIVSEKSWFAKNEIEESVDSLGAIFEDFIYSEVMSSDTKPKEIVTSFDVDTKIEGITYTVPKIKSNRMSLLESANLNADQALQKYNAQILGDVKTRTEGLNELYLTLGLPRAPYRIEGYDISHTGGTYQVGSMVVFKDGMKSAKDYRQFNIKSAESTDDTRAMNEVLQRRFEHVVGKNSDGAGGASSSGSSGTAGGAGSAGSSGPDSSKSKSTDSLNSPPDIILIDGGLPQIHAAKAAIREVYLRAGVDPAEAPYVISIAKRLEEIYTEDSDTPIIFSRESLALFLLIKVRDESHNFAITAHRKRRSKGMTKSKS